MTRRLALLALLIILLASCSSSRGPVDNRRSPSPLGGYTIGEEMSGVTRIYHGDRSRGLAAIATDGARTITFIGPERTFTEPTSTKAVVTTTSWVRVAPQPWHPGARNAPWFTRFFTDHVGDTSPDVLAMSMEYLDGQPMRRDAAGVPVAGDAGFGLLREGGEVDGADFYDYLGIPWRFGGDQRQPDPRWYRKLDCSGFVRLVYGYRSGIPLAGGTSGTRGLPRTAHAMAYGSASVVVAEGATASLAPDRLDDILPGDLVFFALRSETHISHSGIYIGKDQDGHLRFVSSRTLINGPTFGDFHTKSILDQGIFHDRLRRVIRL